MASNDKDPEKGQDRSSTTWPQWLAAWTLSLAILCSGLANGWASPYLARLVSTEENTSVNLTESEISWIASLLSLGRIVGALSGAVCQEYIGRKKVLLLGGIPLACSWVFIICATSVTWLYASRFCSGIGSGMIWPALSLYLGEIADPKIRGSLISSEVNVASVGTFLGNAMGPYLSMEMFGYVCLVPNILFLILFSLIPESPYHFVLHGELGKAEASLNWFRRQSDVQKEISELQEFVQGANTGILTKLKQFILPANIKNALILLGVSAICFASGYNTINSYAEIIVRKTKTDTVIAPSTVVIILEFASIVAGTLAVVVVDKLGRKCLLILSCVGATVTLFMLGLHFHLLQEGFDFQILTWLPLTALLLFYLFVSCGFLPVPSALLSEMFPANLKNMAALLISLSNSTFAFTCSKTFQPFLDLVGERFVFWTYAVLVLFAIPYVYFLIPDTTGKSLLQIQRSAKENRN